MHQPVTYLMVLLRLAVLINRDRIDGDSPVVELKARENALTILFPDGWLDEYPLTRLDLEQESEYLKMVTVDLKFS